MSQEFKSMGSGRVFTESTNDLGLDTWYDVCDENYDEHVYTGDMYENEDFYMIKHFDGSSKILRELHDAGIILIDHSEGETIYYNKAPELNFLGLSSDDYDQIADIFKKLIEMGISLNTCTFTHGESGKIRMCLPFKKCNKDLGRTCLHDWYSVVKYTSNDKVQITKDVYYYNQFIFETGYVGVWDRVFSKEDKICIYKRYVEGMRM